jgi:hypothetical protein
MDDRESREGGEEFGNNESVLDSSVVSPVYVDEYIELILSGATTFIPYFISFSG